MDVPDHFFPDHFCFSADYEGLGYFEGYDEALIERRLKLDESVLDLEAGLRVRLTDRFWAQAVFNFLNSDNQTVVKQSIGIQYHY